MAAAANKVIRCQLAVFRKRKRYSVHAASLAENGTQYQNICFDLAIEFHMVLPQKRLNIPCRSGILVAHHELRTIRAK